MAQLKRDFDAEQVPAADPFELIPDNVIVTVVLDKSEMVTTKGGDGSYLKCEFIVIDGPYENKHLWLNLNLDNPSEKAVAIAERQLSALCHATGKLKVSDSDELHGIPVLAKVGIEPARDGYEAKNKIKDFKPVNEAPTTPSSATTSAGGKKPAPWGKK